MKDGKFQVEAGAVTQPRTLFKPGSWLAKIDFINHLILFNNVLITVLSEHEGGKTSFGTLLQNNLDQQVKSIAMTIKAPCDREQIIKDIAAQLHLNNDSDTNFSAIVTQINERKAHVLLIIDDAQNLPESLIKEAMIAIKSQEDFGFFHLCLISDYSIVATLNNLAVDQFNNLVHSIELGALNESETRTYVLQRAMTASLITRPLSDVQFKQFFQLTRGNVAKINANLEPFILKCSTQQETNKLGTFKTASMAISAVFVCGLSYLYYGGFFTAFTAPKAEIVQAAPAPLVSEIASWQDSSTRQLVHFELPKKQVLDEEPSIDTVALVDKVVVIPTVKTVMEQAAAKQPEVALEQTANNESVLVKFDKIGQNAAVKKAVVKSVSASRYTIQLVASHNVDDVHRFRKNNKLVDSTQVREFTNSKGKWYILTLGEYDNWSNAHAKAGELPAEIAKLNPWIRPVSGLSRVG